MKVYGVVYLLIDGTNDKEYVGQTTCSVKKRFRQHAFADSYIGNAIRAHGADMFVIATLKVCYSKEELDKWERHMIRSRDTKAPNGYNLTDGGDGLKGCTQETRDKISKSKTGKKLSDKARANMSAERKKRYKNPAERAKLSVAQRKRRAEQTESAET